MGVVDRAVFLFIVAYVMRMAAADWRCPALPWQLWLSTALLVLAAWRWQGPARARGRIRCSPRPAACLAGICALAFLGGSCGPGRR
jgi:cytochrome c oxidase subunit 3